MRYIIVKCETIYPHVRVLILLLFQAFSLVLALSQTQTAGFNENCETVLGEDKIKVASGSTSYEAFDLGFGMSKDGKSQRDSHVDKFIVEPKMPHTSQGNSSPSIQPSGITLF